MPSFAYQVRDANGDVRDGTIDALTISEASTLIRSRGVYLLRLVPTRTASGILAKLKKLSLEFGPSLKDVLNFTNQLAVMIKAGINIRVAMESIGDQVVNKKFKRVIAQMKDDVEAGKPLSEALAKHQSIFSPLYVNMVRASELSGNMGTMLTRISSYLDQQLETRSMVRGAMIYPAIIGTMAVFTTTFLLTFVLPRFMKVFEGKEDILPLPTKMLLALTAFLRGYWWAVLIAIIAGVWGFFSTIRTDKGKHWWDTVKLKIPLFSRMFSALYITRGLHTMGELVNAGVPMLNTLRITAEVSGNILYYDMWQTVHDQVKQGEKIAKPLRQQGRMPISVVQMIGAGEESGNLGAVMTDISEFYNKELRATIKTVTAMIEPIMIMLMGLIVGFIAMSIILPIFKMSSLVTQ